MNSSNCPATNTVSFWLLPSESDAALWQPLIDTLADHYDAPRFTPHITIGVASGKTPALVDAYALPRLVEQVAKQLVPLTLDVGPIRTGENFFECVFSLIQGSAVSDVANALAGQVEQLYPEADLSLTSNTHLSLIYSNIKTTQREMLAAQIIAPSPTLIFDKIAAVLPGDGETDFSNPEQWVLHTQRMLGSGESPR